MATELTALILVDDAGTRALVREALHAADCPTHHVAADLDEAATIGRRLAIDVVIADLRSLPSRGDLGRLSRRLRGAPVIAIAQSAELAAAFDAGATDVVMAPIASAELSARVRAALRIRAERARRSNRERRLTEEIRRLERENGDLERMVCVDSLTGLANRRHALALLGAEWKRSAREKTPLSIVMIDLDCFHAFNEHYGHLGGDACLRRVTEAMVRCLRRPSDFVGRYGGEEFMAVLPSTDALGAKLVADRLRAAVEALAIPHASSPCARVVTISAGFATAHGSPDRSVETLLSAADCALLRAKAFGRNGVTGEAPPAPARPAPPEKPWTRFATVVADPWFVDRIPAFLAEVRDEARAIERAGAEDNFARIRMIGRRLKTAAREYSLDQIVRLGNVLENAARFEDRDQIHDAADELEQYTTHVQVIYRRPLEQAS